MSKKELVVIAIVGRPNVGKSTLFNKLARKRKAIVHNTPGITRDRNEAKCLYRDRAFTLVDTGGLLPHSNEAMDIRIQSEKAIAEADLILFVMDGRDGLTPVDEEVYDLLRRSGKPTAIVVNKTEGAGIRQLNEFYALGAETLYPISAEHNQGLSDLLEALYPHLTEPLTSERSAEVIPRIVVMGRPNVGKSTLINTLLREDRLITSSVPGTTRDAIDTQVTYGGRPYIFIDTAGIRKRGKVVYGVEQYSVARAKEALERVDIALLLLDGVEGITEQDTKIAGGIINAGRGFLVLINKSDVLKEEDRARLQNQMRLRFPFLKNVEPIYIAGRTGYGIEPVFKKIDTIYRQFHLRVSTSDLNRFFEKLIQAKPPPTTRGRHTRLYYVTQAATAPPVFVLFSNKADISDSYLQYIENRIRDRFSFSGVPIQMKVRLRESHRA